MHPHCTDYWDGNWLVSPVSLRAGGDLRVVIPAGLRAEELLALLNGLERLEETRVGSVTLDPMEPWLRLTVAVEGRDQLTITGECAKAGESYYATRFELVGLDQSDLPAFVSGLRDVCTAFPVIGRPT